MVDQRFTDYWQQQQQRQLAQFKVLKYRAWQDTQHIAKVLRQDFGATGIFVYGSLVKEQFSAESDIDIAVTGIAKDRFFEAVAVVNDGCDRWVDLKPIESLEPYFWQRIQSQGIWIDEATEFDQLAGTSSGH